MLNRALRTNSQVQPQGAYVSLLQLQQLRHLAEPLPKSVNLASMQSQAGSHSSRALSRGMEFEEVRIYQPGDDVRNIDWRVTARTQITHTKRYRDEKEKPVITLVDQRKTLFFGSQQCFKSVYACCLCALINWATLKRGDRAGGLVIGTQKIHETRPSVSHQATNRWLQILAEHNQQLSTEIQHSEPEFLTVLEQLRLTARKGSDIVIITDCYDLDARVEEHLFHLRQHNQVSLYWLFDPLEKTFPNLGQIAISNGKDKMSLNIDKFTSKTYRELFIQKRQFLIDLSQRLGIRFMEVDISQSLTDLITTGKSP